MMFESTRDFMRVHGAMVTHDTILPGRAIVKMACDDIRGACEVICRKHGVTMRELMGQSIKRNVSIARQDAFLTCRRLGHSYPEIGDFFDRHHTTVMSGCKRAIEREANGDE